MNKILDCVAAMLSNYKIDNHEIRFSHIFIPVVVGIACGMAILYFLGLEAKWVTICLAGMAVPFLSLLDPNPRRFILLLLVFVIPMNAAITFFRYPLLVSGPQGIVISLSDVALFTLLFLWILDISRNKTKIAFHPELSLPYLGFICMCLLSMFSSANIQLSLFEIFSMIKLFLLYLYIVNNIHTKEELRAIVIFLLLGLFLESIIGIIQYFRGSPIGLYVFGEYDELMEFSLDDRMTYRIGGTMGHTNCYAKYLGLLLPLCLSVFIAVSKFKYKLIGGVIFILGTVVLIFTLARAAWVGLIASIMVTLFLLYRNEKSRQKVIRNTIVFGCIFIVVIFIQSGSIISRITSDDHGSGLARIQLAQIAFNMIRTHPFFGVGINNFTVVMRQYDDTIAQISAYFPHPVHNVYLCYASEIGIPGLLFFLWFFIRAYWDGYQNAKSKDILLASIHIGFIAGIVSVAIQGLTGYGFKHGYDLMAIVWLQIGCMNAFRKMQDTLPNKKPNEPTAVALIKKTYEE